MENQQNHILKKFIVVEGEKFSGKTTLIKQLSLASGIPIAYSMTESQKKEFYSSLVSREAMESLAFGMDCIYSNIKLLDENMFILDRYYFSTLASCYISASSLTERKAVLSLFFSLYKKLPTPLITYILTATKQDIEQRRLLVVENIRAVPQEKIRRFFLHLPLMFEGIIVGKYDEVYEDFSKRFCNHKIGTTKSIYSEIVNEK